MDDVCSVGHYGSGPLGSCLVEAARFSQRMVLIIADGGQSIAAKGQMSRNGQSWEPDLQLTYTRISAPSFPPDTTWLWGDRRAARFIGALRQRTAVAASTLDQSRLIAWRLVRQPRSLTTSRWRGCPRLRATGRSWRIC